jgi:hypothetical protein
LLDKSALSSLPFLILNFSGSLIVIAFGSFPFSAKLFYGIDIIPAVGVCVGVALQVQVASQPTFVDVLIRVCCSLPNFSDFLKWERLGSDTPHFE